ncbi:MAG: hypothetical protein MUC97_16740, partial [Bernardetiaceae bacterium]|nr:hypothetical protein [Bernardetiaceae bacterium]
PTRRLGNQSGAGLKTVAQFCFFAPPAHPLGDFCIGQGRFQTFCSIPQRASPGSACHQNPLALLAPGGVLGLRPLPTLKKLRPAGDKFIRVFKSNFLITSHEQHLCHGDPLVGIFNLCPKAQ